MAGSGTDWGSAFGGGSSGGGGGSSSSGPTDWGSAFGGFKPAKSDSGGGGGFLGGVGRFFSEAAGAVQNIPNALLRGAQTTIPGWYHLAQGDTGYFTRSPNNAPLLTGMAQGFMQTAHHITDPGSILHDYAAHPFAAPMNDIGNVSLVAAPVAAGAGAVARGAAEGSALASGAERVAQVAGAVRDAPALPLRAGRSVLTNAAEAAQASGTQTPGFLARLGTKLTPAYQDFIGAALEGKAQLRTAPGIIAGAGEDTNTVIDALRKAGYGPAADAIDAASHTAPLPEDFAAHGAPDASAPPPVMSDNYAKVMDERANPPVPAAATVAPPPTLTGKEYAAALHDAGLHTEANAFAKSGADLRAPLFISRAEIVNQLRTGGDAPAARVADVLEGNVPKPPTTEDVLTGLRNFRTEKLTGIPAEAPAPTPPGAPKVNEPPPGAPSVSDKAVPLSQDEMQRVAADAIRSATGAKLSDLPSVLHESQPGAVALDKITSGQFPAEGALPKVLADKLESRFTPPGKVTKILEPLDPANHAYAQAKINLNPATLMSRLFGHTSVVGLGAPHPLDSLLNAVKVFTGKVSPESEQLLAEGGARLPKGGAIDTFKAQLGEDVARPGVAARAASGIDRLANKSPIGRWAAKMDDAIRKGVYLAERTHGASAEDALRTVNRVAGEFDALSPAEQAIGRRLAPFYNWHKQIALIAEHLAEDHPARAALLTNLGAHEQQYSQQQGTPGEVDFAGHAISPGFLVPLGEAGTTFKAGGLPNLGPIPKAVFGAGFGMNPNTGKPFSGPNQKRGQDYRYEGARENLRKSLPQVGLFDNLRGYNDVARYNSGDPVISHGQPIQTNMSPADAGLTFGGLRSENTQAAKARTAAIAAKASKQTGGSKKSSGGGTDWGAAFGR